MRSPDRYLAAIVSSTDDAIVSKNLNGTVTSWNTAAERMFGYGAGEIVGRSIRLIIPRDRLAEEDELLRRITIGDSVRHFETLRIRKNGSHIPISLTVSPIFGAGGRVIGVSTIARDISERKRIEIRLATIEGARDDLHRRLMMLVAASGKLVGTPQLMAVGTSVLSLAHELVPADGYAIWRLERDAGWRPLAFDGISPEFATVIEPRGSHELQSTATMAIEDAQHSVVVGARRQAYADEGIVSMLMVPLVLHGLCRGTLAFYHRTPHQYSDVDVDTARALGNLTSAAITNAELFTEHQRGVRAGFFADALRRLSVAQNYEAMLTEIAALSVPRFADWSAVDMVDASGQAQRVAAAHSDESRIALAYELQRRHPDAPDAEGSPEWVVASGRTMFLPDVTDEILVTVAHGDQARLQMTRALGVRSFMRVPVRNHGRIIGAMTFAMGESGRRFEHEDLVLAQELARRAAVAIENTQAYEKAESANRIKDSFLALLSHELRTPLNAVLGYTRMLRSNAIAEPRREHALETVERNATVLWHMINDLLDVSRIASGKLTLTWQRVGLRKLVLESLESVAPSASAKGLRMDVQADDDAMLIDGDRARLQQVVWNLLSNAVKFTPPGGHVVVTARTAPEGATIIVRDTGIGIPPAFRSKVFEPFQQAAAKAASDVRGLGLGLAIARQIVAMHGGTISAESEGEGKGSTFTVRLPGHRRPRTAATSVSSRTTSQAVSRRTSAPA